MLYAVVDIETTGSFAGANGVTEIAIVIHDGKKTIDFFESLVNPHVPIPYFIQRLTGIDNEMVATAPSFPDIAEKIYDLLHDKVFVAHNVNFDYSFIKHHLHIAGYALDTKKLCTVRLARKLLPGHGSYSLGKLTHKLGITHTQRHRAGGDALATADLLAMILANDTEGVIQGMLKGRNSEQYLPPHLPVEDVGELPSDPGVYYFYDAAGKPIYVGKAKNIRKRVKSHFSNNRVNQQKQAFLKETHRISFKVCATELMAHILESAEIRRLWPAHNRSQRGFLPRYGLYAYYDQVGFRRLAVEKYKRSFKPIYTFNTIEEGRVRLRELIHEFGLCPRLCHMATADPCGCEEQHEPTTYNEGAEEAISWIKKHLPTFALVDKGLEDNEHSCILVVEGNLYGMGYVTDKKGLAQDLEKLQQQMEPLQDNDYIRNLVFRHATSFPEKCISFAQSPVRL